MAKTITEIAVEVLQEIGRLPSGQVAPLGQVKTVSDAYDGLYDELLNDELVNWASSEDIPSFATDAIIMMLSGRVAGRFGVPNQWRAAEDILRLRLSRQITSPYVSQQTEFGNI